MKAALWISHYDIKSPSNPEGNIDLSPTHCTDYDLGQWLDAFHAEWERRSPGKRWVTEDIKPAHPELVPGEKALMAIGQKIEAIKAIRARLGLGLRDAKDAVEAFTPEVAYFPKQPPTDF